MIVKIQPRGKSFSGLATYLTHDADQAQTAERVAWTHTHNLANDHAGAAVNEMVWTARDAELLKQESGVRAGGRATEKPVWHCSLNWAPNERPTREHMIETADDFLRHMQYDAHQAIYIGHSDKHPHLHIMLNAVHPETGLRLNESFEQRRAQQWALQYEREHGIYCEQRLENPAERERNPPRNVWMEFWVNQKEFEKAEKSLSENEGIFSAEQKNQNNTEWKILKEIQRAERIDFFTEGRAEFKALRNSIYSEVRDEFRGRWADYYSAEKNGADPDALAALKAGIIAEQKAVLEPRRDAACAELRVSRDGRYLDLLNDQRDFRAYLHQYQEAGVDSMPLLMSLRDNAPTQDVSTAFREAAEEVSRPAGDSGRGEFVAADKDRGDDSSGDDRTIADIGVGLTTAFDSLLSIFEGTKPAPRRQPVETGSFESAAAEVQKRAREEDEARERDKQRAFYGE
jgi:hypothetical protein